MIHEHHQWLEDVNEDIVRSYKRDETLARKPGQVQRTGHRVESRWVQVLRDWLPRHYEVGDKRKYLLLETDDGSTVTKETDLVVFYPHYPEKLRDKESVLASGVAAAFSVRRTVGRKDIKDAYKEGVALRRGLRVREGGLQSYLIPPVFFGLLGESHTWKSPASAPKENVKRVIGECEKELVGTPREALDLLCVADLGSWRRFVSVHPGGYLKKQSATNPAMAMFTEVYGLESLVMSGLGHDYEQQSISPLTNFIGALWDKLALNDSTLKPLAGGLRFTRTMDTRLTIGGGSGVHKLADLVPQKIANGYRHQEPWSY